MQIASLEKYTADAEKILCYWLRNRQYKVKDFPELITGLVFILFKSDQSHDKEKIPLSTYRFINCDRFLRKYFNKSFKKSKRYKNFVEGSDKLVPNRENNTPKDNFKLINFLINNAGLTSLEKEHVNLYLEGKSAKDTAELFNTSRANAYGVLKTAIIKMKAITK